MEAKHNLKTICQDYFEQEICKISYTKSNKKIKIIQWCMKMDPPFWITADFECWTIPRNGPIKNHFF